MDDPHSSNGLGQRRRRQIAAELLLVRRFGLREISGRETLRWAKYFASRKVEIAADSGLLKNLEGVCRAQRNKHPPENCRPPFLAGSADKRVG